MKNKKLNLNQLRVKSFVTDLENGKQNTVKGGLLSIIWCKTDNDDCAPHSQACDPGTGGTGSGNPAICPGELSNGNSDCSVQYCD